MGMDLIGNRPDVTFRRNWWYWRPLATYCFNVAPSLMESSNHESHWGTNDGSMTSIEAEHLADILQAELDSGRTLLYLQQRTRELEALPDEQCTICKGAGFRTERRNPSTGLVMVGTTGAKPWSCNSCDGLGTVRPSATHYRFDLSDIPEFITFLRASNGFILS